MACRDSRFTARFMARCIVTIVLLPLAGAASADTFTVTTLADGPVSQGGDLPGSLRQAVFDANAQAGADTIEFDASLAGGTITLTEGEIVFTESATVSGLGADELTISGGNASRVFNLHGSGNSVYTLRGLTIADGNGVSGAWNARGGAVVMFFGNDTLNVDRCVFTNNRTSDNTGGVIAIAEGTLNLTGSALIDNGTSVLDGQGMIYVQDATCSIVNSTFSGNAGNWGVVWVRDSFSGSQLSMSHSTFVDNSNLRGIVFVEGDSSVAYDHSIFADNVRSFTTEGSITLTSNGYNILDDATGATPDPTDMTNTDPLLGALEEFGDTYVFHPTKASPAINGGDPKAVAGVDGAPNYDQRGSAYPRVVETIDIGAVEFKGFIVTTLADGAVSQGGDLPGSLRQAAFDANALAGADTIEFADSLAGGTITLTEGEITFNQTATLNGLGADELTISGGDASRIFNFDGSGNSVFTLRGLTIADGNGVSGAWNARGGAVVMFFGNDTLNVDRCVFTNNRTSDNTGGVIAIAEGTLNLTGSALIDNGTSSQDGQGMIYVQDATCSIVNSTFSGNAGNWGVVWVRDSFLGAELSISHSTFVDNSNLRGAVFVNRVNNDASVTYDHSIFASNARTVTTEGAVTVISDGYNILDDATGASPPDVTDLTNTDPLLGALEETSGTFVFPLRPGSPAVSGGDPMAIAGVDGIPLFDQRGDGFPRIEGERLDIGAVESAGDYCNAADFAAPFGTLNLLDVIEFQSHFVSAGNWADLNDDGVLNFLDFVLFRQLFLEGCP